MNGGALYYSNINVNEINVKDFDESIFIENNIFKENKAHYYGGAMELDFYKLNINKYNNNNITNNEAGVIGGGIYISNFSPNKKISFNIYNNSIFKNNKVGSYDDDYSSRPSSVSLINTIKNGFINVNTGDYITLQFIFKDIFNKDISDELNYYSGITMKLLLINKTFDQSNDNNIEIKNKYKLLRNDCSFQKGSRKKNEL